MSPNPLSIKIWKSKRCLEVWEAGVCTYRCPAGMGRGELGPKREEGDCRTPEGEYHVCVKNPQSRFHLSLGLDYPNQSDARRGFAEGRIDGECLARVLDAHAKGQRPPWDTPLGGEIYIHGDLDVKEGSRGCVALNNEDIETIYARVPVGTRVTIFP